MCVFFWGGPQGLTETKAAARPRRIMEERMLSVEGGVCGIDAWMSFEVRG